MTFDALHNYLQWMIGWQGAHVHEFRVGARCIGPDWQIREIEPDDGAQSAQDERRASIAAVVCELGGVGGEFEYHYDVGDGWVHRCIIEMMSAAWSQLELRIPACTAGENACPPEDVGGPHGYVHSLGCISDRSHPEHADALRWVGGVFDRKGFDLNQINRDWKRGRRGGRIEPMNNTRPGLYDSLITEELSSSIAKLDRSLVPIKGELRPAEVPDRISLRIARLVARAIDTLDEKERAKAGIALARHLIAEIHRTITKAEVEPEQLIETGEILQAISLRSPDGTAEAMAGPLIPLLDTTLLTNAPGEPRIGSQLVTEIESSDAISVVMAFIRSRRQIHVDQRWH